MMMALCSGHIDQRRPAVAAPRADRPPAMYVIGSSKALSVTPVDGLGRVYK